MSVISWPLRILLFVGSAVVFILISRCIRKKKILMRDGIFWMLFSFLLALVSVFPVLAVWASQFFGIQSPSNCVFMVIIFLLGCHEFYLTIRVSRLEMKNNRLIQNIALYRALEEEAKSREKENLLLLR